MVETRHVLWRSLPGRSAIESSWLHGSAKTRPNDRGSIESRQIIDPLYGQTGRIHPLQWPAQSLFSWGATHRAPRKRNLLGGGTFESPDCGRQRVKVDTACLVEKLLSHHGGYILDAWVASDHISSSCMTFSCKSHTRSSRYRGCARHIICNTGGAAPK